MIAEQIKIGTFKRARTGGWDGEINTLTISARCGWYPTTIWLETIRRRSG